MHLDHSKLSEITFYTNNIDEIFKDLNIIKKEQSRSHAHLILDSFPLSKTYKRNGTKICETETQLAALENLKDLEHHRTLLATLGFYQDIQAQMKEKLGISYEHKEFEALLSDLILENSPEKQAVTAKPKTSKKAPAKAKNTLADDAAPIAVKPKNKAEPLPKLIKIMKTAFEREWSSNGENEQAAIKTIKDQTKHSIEWAKGNKQKQGMTQSHIVPLKKEIASMITKSDDSQKEALYSAIFYTADLAANEWERG